MFFLAPFPLQIVYLTLAGHFISLGLSFPLHGIQRNVPIPISMADIMV